MPWSINFGDCLSLLQRISIPRAEKMSFTEASETGAILSNWCKLSVLESALIQNNFIYYFVLRDFF